MFDFTLCLTLIPDDDDDDDDDVDDNLNEEIKLNSPLYFRATLLLVDEDGEALLY